MKRLTQFFVLGLALMLPVVQAQAAANTIDNAVSKMHSELSAAKSKADFDAASKNFFANIQSASAADRDAAVADLKSNLTYEAQRKVDALVESIEAGIYTKAEIQAKVTDIAKSATPTGAAWDGEAALIIGGSVLIVAGLIAIALTSSSTTVSTGYYYDQYCYYDYYYGYYCYYY